MPSRASPGAVTADDQFDNQTFHNVNRMHGPGVYMQERHEQEVVGICMVLEQSLVEVCLEGLNGVSMCPVVWEWCMNACEKSVRGLWG